MDRTYTFGTATLRLRRSPRHGSVSTPAGTWPIHVKRWRPLTVAGVVLPGGPVRWEVTRTTVGLVRDGARIVVGERGWWRKTTTVEVTGAWADRDLAVATAVFALGRGAAAGRS